MADVVVPEAVRLIDSTPLPGKAVAHRRHRRKGRAQRDRPYLRPGLIPEPVTRAAALGALAKLAVEADLPRLVGLLEKATDGDDILHLQEAVAAAALRNAAPGDAGGPRSSLS